MTRSGLLSISVAFLVVASVEAMAATRTVCFTLTLVDNRTNCATSSEVGARRGCRSLSANSRNWVYARGQVVEAWDKDPDGVDEYIGSWVLSYEGTNCLTFEWENASYALGEANPDVYLRMVNRVMKSSARGISAYARNTDGSADYVIWSRNGPSSNPDQFTAADCRAGTNCYINGNNWLYPTSDVNSELGRRYMMLDSAQHALEIYGDTMTQNVNLRYPGQASCPTSCANDRGTISITEAAGNDGGNVTHEIGHSLQMQEFGQDYLQLDCSQGGDWHSMVSAEYDSCSTTEGWADYVATVAWYNPDNPAVVPLFYGYNLEQPTPLKSICSSNRAYELQTAKAFWDLDDANAEAGAGVATGWPDTTWYSTTFIAKQWADFPDGFSDRQDAETGAHGVNMKDYYYNNSADFGPYFYNSFLRHNCLQSQEEN